MPIKIERKDKMALQHFDEEGFQEALTSKQLMMVDFWATWCGPCKMMAPVIDEIAGEVDDVKVGKLNIDENMEVAQKYGVMSIPTLIVFQNGEVLKKDLGAKPKSAVLQMLGK